jgi:hypothetical protein
VRGSAALGLCVLAYTACWLRGKLERFEAIFTVADRIYATGVPAHEISAGYHWDGYHGAFDDWLAQSGALANPSAYAGPHRVDKAYHRFVAERFRTASYLVVEPSAALVIRVGGRSITLLTAMALSPAPVVALKRIGQRDGASRP